MTEHPVMELRSFKVVQGIFWFGFVVFCLQESYTVNYHQVSFNVPLNASLFTICIFQDFLLFNSFLQKHQ